MDFLASFGYVGIFLVVALIVAAIFVLIPFFLAKFRMIPKNPNPVKNATYECGMETVGRSWVQFNFRYYLVALLFVVFDVETVFLYPWAVAFHQLKLFGLIEMLVFIAILVVGLVYAWKKGALEWR